MQVTVREEEAVEKKEDGTVCCTANKRLQVCFTSSTQTYLHESCRMSFADI